MIRELKILPEFFEAVTSGRKQLRKMYGQNKIENQEEKKVVWKKRQSRMERLMQSS
ncbi:hypothetical protein [Enterococcus faecium]|uniref:hypothetical protein n=1 Tax=Enterococcus faecium TaxID=1352 RepID=UPI000B69D9A3|nr:hypothetical protein [Enterococcus faecium]OTN92418.1 hypothetical protein A5809_001807 [Enterococcus faecium]